MASTFVYNAGESKSSKGELDMEFGIFFDGTLNSKFLEGQRDTLFLRSY